MAEIRRRIRQASFQDRLNPLEVLSDEEVFRRYRFRGRTIMDIVEMLFPFLERPTKRSSPLPPLLSVLVTLYFLASGANYMVIGHTRKPPSLSWDTSQNGPHSSASSEAPKASKRLVRLTDKEARDSQFVRTTARRTNERTNRRTNGRRDERTDGRKKRQTNGRTDERRHYELHGTIQSRNPVSGNVRLQNEQAKASLNSVQDERMDGRTNELTDGRTD
ncbi:hypothetical protein DPMN_068740 [Dreissena polymorpha]|uniref:Uncharacterized protein n=1 Tax=Dreissena polymorpha TaxID=45954 RepID=A0A9D4BWU5_DREPO|nr:hypothetical protein DPMN_068740 [Dreissena polymorpha]